MSPKPYNSAADFAPSDDYDDDTPLVTTPEPAVTVVAKDGDHLEAAIDGQMFYVSLACVHGRMAARAYAYSLAAEDPTTARAILRAVGREG